MTKIILTRDMALGNGTRPPGFLLGSCGGDLAELCGAIATGELTDDLLGSIEPAEGVEITEVMTALRNQHLVTDQEPTEAAAELSQPQPQPDKGEDKATWKDLPIERLAVAEQVHAILREKGIKTLGELDSYAEKHKGLTSIKGIGSSTEEHIAEAMKAVLGGTK